MNNIHFYILINDNLINSKISSLLINNGINIQPINQWINFEDLSIILLDNDFFDLYESDIYKYTSEKQKHKKWFFTLIDNRKKHVGGSVYLNSIKGSELSKNTLETIIENRMNLINSNQINELKQMEKLARVFHLYHLFYEEQGVDIKEVAIKFGVSERTIRRDFNLIETVVGTDKIVLDQDSKCYYLTK
jgi:hypothetical protein